MRCAHKFHGQCLCDYLVHDRRCPICRDSPSEDNFYESDDDDMTIEESPIRFSEAMRAARDARKTDKRVDAMFKTFKKWKKERKNLGKTLRECNDRLRPLEQAFDDKMIEYEKKEQVKFDKKHNKVLTTRDDTLKAISKATVHIHASQTRIAKKFGFVRRTFRSRRRSRFSHGEDEEEE